MIHKASAQAPNQGFDHGESDHDDDYHLYRQHRPILTYKDYRYFTRIQYNAYVRLYKDVSYKSALLVVLPTIKDFVYKLQGFRKFINK